MTSKDKGILVQKISEKVLGIYNEIQSYSNITQDAKLSVIKSTKVRPRALLRSLENCKNGFVDKNLKTEVECVMANIEDMVPGGETRLFVCHTKEDTKTKLEFVCAAVRMYKYENENVCDYCVSTYSYSKSIDKAGMGLGIGLLTTGLAFSAVAAFGFITGGTGFIVLGSISTLVASGTTLFGTVETIAASDTQIQAEVRDLLEAYFLKELVDRGHATLQDSKLFITNGESD